MGACSPVVRLLGCCLYQLWGAGRLRETEVGVVTETKGAGLVHMLLNPEELGLEPGIDAEGLC